MQVIQSDYFDQGESQPFYPLVKVERHVNGTSVDKVIKELQCDFRAHLDKGATDPMLVYQAMFPDWPSRFMVGYIFKKGQPMREIRGKELATESEEEERVQEQRVTEVKKLLTPPRLHSLTRLHPLHTFI